MLYLAMRNNPFHILFSFFWVWLLYLYTWGWLLLCSVIGWVVEGSVVHAPSSLLSGCIGFSALICGLKAFPLPWHFIIQACSLSLFNRMGVGREVSISLDGVRDKNLMQLKKLNIALFPVRYNDKYYADALASGEFTKLGSITNSHNLTSISFSFILMGFPTLPCYFCCCSIRHCIRLL